MRLLLGLSLVAGFVLRFIWGMDMEFKGDEEVMFNFTQDVGVTEPWPWLGMPSGVHLHNPPLSVWVFVVLARLFRVTDPEDLARIVQGLDWLAIALIIPFAQKLIPKEEREPWYWAAALASVNPFAVLYHRKIWAQSILPFFSLAFLAGWLKRGTRLGALVFGGVGIALGQIHMSGFFFFAAFVLCATIYDRASVRWRWFALGAGLGAIPMIPWAVYFFTAPRDEALVFGVGEAVQLKFWVFWITDSIGLHLGNSLKGHLWEFLSNPLVAALHIAALGIALLILLPGVFRFLRVRMRSPHSPTDFTLGAAFWGYGILITAATVAIRRYYLLITFPLEWVWLGAIAIGQKRRGRKLLFGLWVVQLAISAAFLIYIHQHGGAPEGDYGVAYRDQVRSRILSPER